MNKPVAWMVNNKSYEDIFEAEHYSKFTNKPMIPLYTHPVKELTPAEYEKTMKHWDYWRKQIADGDTSSAPRDWFESTIDYLLNYSHSVKELTDEEIKQVWNDNLAVMGNDLQFARAILRKAQEK